MPERERESEKVRERAYLIAYAEAERINCEELISRVVHFIVQFTLILWAMNSRKGVGGKGFGHVIQLQPCCWALQMYARTLTHSHTHSLM